MAPYCYLVEFSDAVIFECAPTVELCLRYERLDSVGARDLASRPPGAALEGLPVVHAFALWAEGRALRGLGDLKIAAERLARARDLLDAHERRYVAAVLSRSLVTQKLLSSGLRPRPEHGAARCHQVVRQIAARSRCACFHRGDSR